ncbi:MAG: hypothetical protein LBF77_07750 [Spirochaetaceae bacterium]|jgi:hypothetical protein|nr:hypothetical protein [Spirochaetaceae bacterium]
MIIKNGKVPTIGVVVVLLLFAVFPLAAQIPEPVSNTKNASAGLFGNDVDNFMNYFGFGGAAFDNWFGYAGYQNTAEAGSLDNNSSRFSLGLARRLGGFYLGVWYNGNVIEMSNGSLHEKYPGGTVDIDGGSRIGLEDQHGEPSLLYSVNQIQFLLGFSRFALKLGFQEELGIKNFTGPRTEDGVTRRHDESAIKGYIAGDIGAGLPISIGDLTLKVNLDTRVFFHLDSVDNISEASGTTTRWGEHGDYVRPEINLALNLDIPGNYGDVFTPGVSYTFSTGFYNNKYNVNGVTGNVKGKVRWGKGSTRYGDLSIADVYISENPLGIFELAHTITPRFNYSGNLGDRLKLGVFTKVPVLIFYDSYDHYEEKTTVPFTSRMVSIEHLQPGRTDISNLVITPELDLGASFQAIPGRLALNAGLILAFKYRNYVKTVNSTGFSSTSTNGEISALMSDRAQDVSIHDSGWNFDSPLGVRAGFTLNFNPRFMVDAYFNPIEPSAIRETINVVQFSLLFSLKG